MPSSASNIGRSVTGVASMSFERNVLIAAKIRPCTWFEEMHRFQPVDQIVGETVIDHHRTQHRSLRLDVARQLLGFFGA